ncbi:MAG: DUF3644 domain-containing protein [Gordonibacter sp.]|uniref:DUF3644 domain-containing protein n=1 Tax=Gordonibacter sp. TaxID=1968902 RepID=UPI002FCC634D
MLRKGSKSFRYADKAQQSMLAAVEIFNSPLVTFKSEICITLITLAWTYLFQSYCEKHSLETRQYETKGKRKAFKRGKDGHILEQPLSELLNIAPDFISSGAKNNILFLIGIRNSIQHSANSDVDPLIAPKIQANVLNFKVALNELSENRMDIGAKLPLALQFAELSLNQTKELLTATHADPLLTSFILEFEGRLTPEERQDTTYEARVRFDLENRNRGSELIAMKVIKPGETIPEDATILANKEVEKLKYRPSEVIDKMNSEGYSSFKMHVHTTLWQSRNARRECTGYGTQVSNQWYWYEKWIDEVVRPYCQKTYSSE